MAHQYLTKSIFAGVVAFTLLAAGLVFARPWTEAEFESRPLIGYPMPSAHDSVIGVPVSYTISQGDTLLDIGRWYGLSGTEISDANGHLDWWAPTVGRAIVLPTERILPEGPRNGIVMNIPEMRIYYYYPTVVPVRRRHGKATRIAYAGSAARVVYTFPVGLGRFDWKTPVAAWTVTGKVRNPTWVVPQDIYEEHLERDGEADHVVPGGEADNPLGHYKLALSLPEYAIHGTDVPWGVGMNVSHGCIRLYPEDIERLFNKTAVGTPGRFVYQPIKFGWRGDALYVEVHDDVYGVYPGLWNHALQEVKRLRLASSVDMSKLEKAVEEKKGVATYVMSGPEPTGEAGTASAMIFPAPPGGPEIAATTATTDALAPAAVPPTVGTTTTDLNGTNPSLERDVEPPRTDADTAALPPAGTDTDTAAPASAASDADTNDGADAGSSDSGSHDDWAPLPPSHISSDDAPNPAPTP